MPRGDEYNEGLHFSEHDDDEDDLGFGGGGSSYDDDEEDEDGGTGWGIKNHADALWDSAEDEEDEDELSPEEDVTEETEAELDLGPPSMRAS